MRQYLAKIRRLNWANGDFIVAPLLVGFAPIFYLYSRNTAELQSGLIVKPTLVVAASTILACLFLKRFLKDGVKIGLSLSLAWVWFTELILIGNLI